MQFLSLSRRLSEKFSNDDFAAKRGEEEDSARRLYASGALRQIWMRGDEPGACLIWEAKYVEEVRRHLFQLPYLAAGMTEIVAIIPLNPYPGFGPR